MSKRRHAHFAWLQSWYTWSDGRKFTKHEDKKLRLVLARSKVNGETYRQRFERVRAVIEQYEENKKAVLITEPGVIAKAWNWLTGSPNVVKLEVPRK